MVLVPPGGPVEPHHITVAASTPFCSSDSPAWTPPGLPLDSAWTPLFGLLPALARAEAHACWGLPNYYYMGAGSGRAHGCYHSCRTSEVVTHTLGTSTCFCSPCARGQSHRGACGGLWARSRQTYSCMCCVWRSVPLRCVCGEWRETRDERRAVRDCASD